MPEIPENNENKYQDHPQPEVAKPTEPPVSAPPLDEKKPPARVSASKISSWQNRLLPLMVVLLLGLTLFFFISTYIQMSYLHSSILSMPGIDIHPASDAELLASAETFDDRLAARELEVRSIMEAYVVAQRYHQSNVFLMSGLWIRYLGFITGMILAIVGASFVLGKLREPPQKLEGRFPGIDISLRTASPGIILVVLGVVLMLSTLLNRSYFNVTDGNIYLPYAGNELVVTSEPSPIGTLMPLDETLQTPFPGLEENPPASGP